MIEEYVNTTLDTISRNYINDVIKYKK